MAGRDGNFHHDLGRILELLTTSRVHRTWTVDDIRRCIVPPVELGQYHVDENGFVTWAWLTIEAADGFVTRTRKLQPEDWAAGQNLWFMDLVGDVRGLARTLRRGRFRDVHATARWARSYGTGRVRKIGMVRQ